MGLAYNMFKFFVVLFIATIIATTIIVFFFSPTQPTEDAEADKAFLNVLDEAHRLHDEAQPFFHRNDFEGFCNIAIKRANLLLAQNCSVLSEELRIGCEQDKNKEKYILEECGGS